jgi:hypothetical protein
LTTQGGTDITNWKRIAEASIAVGSSLLATGGLAGGVAAAGSCPTRTTSAPFTAWGDSNSYFVVPGATFEGAHGWSFGGSISVVADQEPWKVNGSGHAKSLSLPAYTTAMAPNVCIASNEDSLRLFYKDPGVNGAKLLVKIEAWNSAGTNGRVVQEYKINAGTVGWKLSPRISLPNNRDAAGEQWVTITVTPTDTAATWRIDDMMLDPWISR